MRKFSFILFLFLSTECHQDYTYPSAVNTALEAAGENKSELIEVLEKYGESPQDSLKFQAACYLIASMPGHFSNKQFIGVPELITQSFLSMDSLVQKNYFKPYNPETIEASNDHSQAKSATIRGELINSVGKIEQKEGIYSDLKTIKGVWLVEHIENAFKVWNESPLASRLTFREFKEYILPYRYREEALDYSASEYKLLLSDILRPSNTSTVDEIVNKINTYTTAMSPLQKKDALLGDLGPYDPLQFNVLACERHSEWVAHALNSLGVPAVYDFTPSWLNRARHHYWVAVRDTLGVFRPFTPMWQALNDTIYFNETSKVFRRTFTSQASPSTRTNKKEEIPPIFDTPFITDVTDEYHKVTDLKLPFKIMKKLPTFGYLSIFSSKGWEPIAWGTRDAGSNEFRFSKVPLYVVYTPGIYYKGAILPQSEPFYLDKHNEMQKFIPDYDHRIHMTLTRKFHEKGHLIDMMIDMVGSKVQGANKSDFSDAKDMHVLDLDDMSAMALKSIKVKGNQRYRHIRILPPSGKLLNIASLKLYSKNNAKSSKKFLEVPSEPLADTTGYPSLLDGNLETYITSKSIELDLKVPVSIAEIQLAPRNSNNAIIVGDTYELFYHDNKWISAGEKKAETNIIVYNNIPSKTLGISCSRNKPFGMWPDLMPFRMSFADSGPILPFVHRPSSHSTKKMIAKKMITCCHFFET